MSDGMVRLSERRPENGQRVRVRFKRENKGPKGTLRFHGKCSYQDGYWKVRILGVNGDMVAELDDLWMPEESDA